MNGGLIFLAAMRSHYTLLKNLCCLISAISSRIFGSTTKIFFTRSFARLLMFLGRYRSPFIIFSTI